VLLVHYSDLKSNLEAEIRRIAAFCDIDVDEDGWDAVVASVGLDAMRTEAGEDENRIALMLDGGADRFYFKGTNGRWRDVLTDADLALYDRAVATLEPELRHWLEHGREGVEISP
jgi:aryl sulfotransferase